MNYHTIAVFAIFLILGTGLATAGTLTLNLEPSLDGKGDIRATSITEAVLSNDEGLFFDPGAVVILRRGNFSSDNLTDAKEKMDALAVNVSNNESLSWTCDYNTLECSYQIVKSLNRPFNAATINNGTARFNLSDGDAGGRYIMINNLYSDLIPTRIDDPTKDIHQFVGQKLRVSVIGNLSDPSYRIETFTVRQGYDYPTVSYYDPTNQGVLGIFGGDVYIILSLETKTQRFEVVTLGSSRLGRGIRIIDYTPTAPTHPSTSTSNNPSFSKWVFSHGVDYGGNDSKCSNCHGNLDTKPSKFSEITVNNGFCFRCHYGKGGSEKGFVVDTIGLGIGTPAPTTTKPTTVSYTPVTTTVNPTATPRTSAFEALSAIAALAVLRCRLSR